MNAEHSCGRRRRLRLVASSPRELGPEDFPKEPIMYVGTWSDGSTVDEVFGTARFLLDVDTAKIWLRPDLSPREARRAWGEAFVAYLAATEQVRPVPGGVA